MRLRGQVAAATVLTALAAVVLVAGLGTILAGRFLEAAALRDLTRQAEATSDLARAVNRFDPGSGAAVRASVLESVLANLFGRTGIGGEGIDLDDLSGTSAALLDAEEVQRLLAGEIVDGTAEQADGDAVVYVAVPGPPPIVLYRPVGEFEEASNEVGRRLLLAGAIAAVAAGSIGLWLGGRLARPVRAIADAAHALTSGRLDRRVPEDVAGREDEIGDLARDFDRMAAALEASRNQQREFFLSVGHELKTPLTNIQGYAEGLLDDRFVQPEARHRAAAVIHDESLRLTRLVSDVLTLARLDADTFVVDAIDCDLAAIVRAAVAAAKPIGEGAGVDLAADTEPTPVTTDPDRLRQIVDNLLANALRVTPENGRIDVACRPTPGGGGRVEVTDSGPGLDRQDVDVAFERYALWRRYRGEREVGTGLGLSIVAELADRLGGDVEVDPGGNGRGATFAVRLGASPPAGAADSRT